MDGSLIVGHRRRELSIPGVINWIVSSISGREVGQQETYAPLDLVGDFLERGIRCGIVVARAGGVGDAPMGGDRRPRKLWADLAHLVAKGDHPVEAVTGEARERLRRTSRNIDAALGHGPHGVGMQRLGMAAGAPGLDRAGGAVLDEGLGDLRTGAVAGAQEQQPRSGASPRTISRRRERPRGGE